MPESPFDSVFDTAFSGISTHLGADFELLRNSRTYTLKGVFSIESSEAIDQSGSLVIVETPTMVLRTSDFPSEKAVINDTVIYCDKTYAVNSETHDQATTKLFLSEVIESASTN